MSKMLILNEHDVEQLLTMRECIEVMEQALASLARGEVHNPLRSIVRAADATGFLGLMPAFRGGDVPRYGLKEVCIFPGNPARGLDTHLGAVLLHDGENGQLMAVINASAITAIRTAAVSAVATKLLARENAHTLAIIGAGVQGKSHLEAIPLVRDIDDVRIVSRTREKADALVRKGVRVVDSIEQAVKGADIIVTATSAREPIIRRNWLDDGVHINAVGSSIAASRELDSDTVAASSLFVDRRESTMNESGDYLSALREGAITDGHIRAELGEILLGRAEGRTSPTEITLFKSLGLAVEDLAAAQFLYEKASREEAGTWVDF
jgi:ornithine cyclodeaminase/alanine dehydrogenase-like protein (mu-crystallin family)